MHYRNRVFSTYRFRTGTYRYVLSTDRYRKSILVQTCTYRYVLSMYQNNVMYVDTNSSTDSAVNDSRYPTRISYRMYASSSQDILQGYLIQDILLGYPIGYPVRISSELILVTYLRNLSICSG
jgi:hypothetical protein